MAIKHGVHDTDTHFVVDPITRAAKNEKLKKVSIVRDDHNSEVFTFELPRYIEGHDMAKCNRVEVHYLNTHSLTKETSTGIYAAADFGICETDPEKVIFSWVISCGATKFAGSLAFSLHFACIDAYTDEIRYWWSSATNTSITVLDSINNSESGGGGGGGGGGEEPAVLQEKTVTPTSDTQVVRPDGEYNGLSKVVVEAIPEEYVVPSGSLFVDANGEYEIRAYDKITVNVPDVPAVLQEKELTANGVYTPSAGFDGFSQITVNVSDAPAVLQEKQTYPTTSEQSVEPDEGFDGLSKVTVEAMRLQSVTASKNGDIIPDHGYDGLDRVTVQVTPNLQSKSLTYDKNGDYAVTADDGYDGLDSVSVTVDVDGAGELQTKTIVANGEYAPDKGYDGFSEVTVALPMQEKTITENGEHTPDEGYEAFSSVKAEVPQHVYTGEKYAPGTEYPVYGGIQDNIVVGGYTLSQDHTQAPVYTAVSFPYGYCANMTPTYGTNMSFKVVYVSSSSGQETYRVSLSCDDGDELSNFMRYNTYNAAKSGVVLAWGGTIHSPEDGYPYGYVPATIRTKSVSSTGGEVYGGPININVGFTSEAEYNAAINLVYKPTTIIKINEEVFYPVEETEA